MYLFVVEFPTPSVPLRGPCLPQQKRLQKELMSLLKEPPAGVTVDVDTAHTKLTE